MATCSRCKKSAARLKIIKKWGTAETVCKKCTTIGEEGEWAGCYN